MQRASLTLLLVCVSFIQASPINEQVQEIEDQFKATVLLSTGPQSDPAFSAALSPLLGLVDGMLEQIANDTANDLETLNAAQQPAQNEINTQTAALQREMSYLQVQQAIVGVLQQQLNNATQVLDTVSAQLPVVRSERQQNDDSCLAQVPNLTKQQTHTQNDLAILNLLSQRLAAIAANSSSTAQFAVLLPQIHHSLRLFKTPVATSLLKPLSSAEEKTASGVLMETEASGADMSQMSQLLNKLTTELQAVLATETQEIQSIQSACALQAQALVTKLQQLNQTLQQSQSIVTARTAEIASASANITSTQANINSLQQSIAGIQSSIQAKRATSVAMIANRQQLVLILAQMRSLLVTLIQRLDQQQLPLVLQ